MCHLLTSCSYESDSSASSGLPFVFAWRRYRHVDDDAKDVDGKHFIFNKSLYFLSKPKLNEHVGVTVIVVASVSDEVGTAQRGRGVVGGLDSTCTKTEA